MKELAQFNSFGLVKVTRYECTVTITAVTTSGKPINRVLLQELDPEQQTLEDGQFLTATFGAMIEPKRSRIAFNDMIAVPDKPLVGDVPGVQKSIAQAIDMVRKDLDR